MKRLALFLAAAAGFAAPQAAVAQLASQSSTFTGTVGAICTVSDAVQATTPMFINGAGTELSGVTDNFSFISNGPVAVQLRAVEINAQPAGTSAYTFGGSLNKDGSLIASSTPAAASAAVNYAALASTDLFTMGLSVQNSGNVLAQGTYTAVLTTDCIAQ